MDSSPQSQSSDPIFHDDVVKGITSYIDTHVVGGSGAGEVPEYLTVFLDRIDFYRYLVSYRERYSKIEYESSSSKQTTIAKSLIEECLGWANKVNTAVDKFVNPYVKSQNNSVWGNVKNTFKIGTASAYDKIVSLAPGTGRFQGPAADRARELMIRFANNIVRMENEIKIYINNRQSSDGKFDPTNFDLTKIDSNALKNLLLSSSLSKPADVGGSRRRKPSRSRRHRHRSRRSASKNNYKKVRKSRRRRRARS